MRQRQRCSHIAGSSGAGNLFLKLLLITPRAWPYMCVDLVATSETRTKGEGTGAAINQSGVLRYAVLLFSEELSWRRSRRAIYMKLNLLYLFSYEFLGSLNDFARQESRIFTGSKPLTCHLPKLHTVVTCRVGRMYPVQNTVRHCISTFGVWWAMVKSPFLRTTLHGTRRICAIRAIKCKSLQMRL